MSAHRPRARPWLALALATGMCAAVATRTQAEAWDQVRDRADSLAATGQFTGARELMRSARAFVREPYARAWACRERQALERDYAAIARAPAADRESLAVATRELRAALTELGRDAVPDAERHAARALAIRALLLGARHPATADAGMALAQAAFVLARVPLVDSLATAATRCYEAAYGADHPKVADAEELLGRSLKNFTGAVARSQAMAHYDRAVCIRVLALGAWAPEVGESFHEIGNLERLSGNREAALAAFRRALEIRRQADGAQSHSVASTLGAMAMLEAERANWPAAESLCTAAVTSAPMDAGLSPRSRAFRLGLLGQILRQEGRASEASTWMRRSLAVQESLWATTARDAGTSVFSGLSLYLDLAVALAQQGQPDSAFAALEQGTNRTLVEQELARRAGPSPQVTLAEIQRAMPADVALVSWIESRFGTGYRGEAWACVLRTQGPPHFVRLPGSNRVVTGRQPFNFYFWQSLKAAARWPWRLAAGDADAAFAREMGRTWFTPLEPYLEGAQHIVVFSPDLVNGGPLSALVDSSGRPIVDRFAISYVPSATWYALAARPRPAPARDAPTLVVADPAFRVLAQGGWRPLAGSRDEITTTRATLRDVRVLEGTQACARSLRDLARRGELAHFRVLHFSTHTAVDEVGALESALVLAPDAPGEPESRVTAREIADTWHLDAELVCLTGCESYAGMRSASQGWLGLQQALLRAGARSVLVSAWRVEDRAGAFLIREFYSRLGPGSDGQARARALRDAQEAVRHYRAPDGSQPYAHPAYWAGFTLIGGPS